VSLDLFNTIKAFEIGGWELSFYLKANKGHQRLVKAYEGK
jgi:hypothetical protein